MELSISTQSKQKSTRTPELAASTSNAARGAPKSLHLLQPRFPPRWQGGGGAAGCGLSELPVSKAPAPSQAAPHPQFMTQRQPLNLTGQGQHLVPKEPQRKPCRQQGHMRSLPPLCLPLQPVNIENPSQPMGCRPHVVPARSLGTRRE